MPLIYLSDHDREKYDQAWTSLKNTHLVRDSSTYISIVQAGFPVIGTSESLEVILRRRIAMPDSARELTYPIPKDTLEKLSNAVRSYAQLFVFQEHRDKIINGKI